MLILTAGTCLVRVAKTSRLLAKPTSEVKARRLVVTMNPLASCPIPMQVRALPAASNASVV